MSKTLVKKLLAFFGIGINPVPKKYLFGANSLTTIRIGKYDLQLNKNHSLGYNMKHYPLYNQNLPRLVSFLKSSFPNVAVIDVGANVGDTVLFIKNREDVPVICIEGDPYYYDLLKKNTAQFPDVQTLQVFLSDKDEKLKAALHIDRGTLSVNEKAEGREISVVSLDSIINANPARFADVKILKTDTDGYDMKILRGAWNFLAERSPVLFFEYDRVFLQQQNEEGIDMLRRLAGMGYYRIFFYDNYGRFITAVTLDQVDTVTALHDYIKGYKAPFEFYDLCIFHRKDDELALRFYSQEKLINAG